MNASRTALFAVLALPLGACASPGAPAGSAPSPGAAPAAVEAVPARAVYTGSGRAVALDDVVQAMESVSVVFVGEEHDDSLGHVVEMELLAAAYLGWGATDEASAHGGRGARDAAGAASFPETRSLVLSLEMFERDVQGVVDEYLAGLIGEEHFLDAARPWDRYATDYRPMMEFARAHDLPVVAANAPRRYVNLVAREGLDALDRLSDEALEHLPARPIPEASERYQAQWDSIAGGAAAHAHMPPHLLEAQTLWDAAMAHAVARAVDAHPRALVLHYTGAFHVSHGTGTPEALQAYRPGTRDLVVVIRPAEDPRVFPEELEGAGDFVILTRSEG